MEWEETGIGERGEVRGEGKEWERIRRGEMSGE